MTNNNNNINAVFYAKNYHPIQAGSIDGTDILPHDNAVYRALLCSSAGLYDPFGDPKVIGAPYCTLFVGHLSPSTTEDTLLKCMSRYGRVKNLRLVRDIVTGASRGYAFVEFETEREIRQAYEDAHHSYIDDSEIIVDYNRQQLMAGWIPRRLGGGLGGKKESGQLRFGGRERPFRAPLRPIPYEDLKRLGIPSPPEERYMSRFQVPPPPRRKRSSEEREDSPHRREKKSEDRDVTLTRIKGTSSRRERVPKERETPSPGRKRNTEEREASLPRTKRKSEGREMSTSRRNRDSDDREMTPTRRKRRSYDRGISPPTRERHSKERETSSPKRKRSSFKRDIGKERLKNDEKESHQHKRSRGRDDLSEE